MFFSFKILFYQEKSKLFRNNQVRFLNDECIHHSLTLRITKFLFETILDQFYIFQTFFLFVLKFQHEYEFMARENHIYF